MTETAGREEPPRGLRRSTLFVALNRIELGGVCAYLVLSFVTPPVLAQSATRMAPPIEERPISDPVAPEFVGTRLGFALGAGWRGGPGPHDAAISMLGVAQEWLLGEHFALGPTASYWVSGGPSNFQALAPGARFRWISRARTSWPYPPLHLELDGGASYRVGLTHLSESHFAIGAGALLVAGAFRIGVRYERAFEREPARDVVLVFTERTTDTAVGGSARGEASGPSVGLGLHAVAGGWDFGRSVYLLPGFALELPVMVAGPLAAVGRWDLLWIRGLRSNVLLQSVLGGAQLGGNDQFPFGVSALVGYGVVHGRDAQIDGGAVGDAGLDYALPTQPSGPKLGLHGRFGLGHGNADLRALYVSIGAVQFW